MAYTTTSEVSAELGGTIIDANSTPNISQVTSWIAESDAEINKLTNRVWESTSISGSDYEYKDYKGNGRLILNNAPIISIESLEFESEGLGADASSWTALTEGRTDTSDFILYKEEGLVVIRGTQRTAKLRRGFQNIRVQYTYGKETVPETIKRLSTLMTAKRYILSVANKTASEEGGAVSVGTIRVDDPNNYVHNHYDRIQKEIKYYLDKVVGSFKIYDYDNNIYD